MRTTLRQLRKIQRENSRQRLEFVRWYADWLRKTPNKAWSPMQNRLLSFKALPRAKRT